MDADPPLPDDADAALPAAAGAIADWQPPTRLGAALHALKRAVHVVLRTLANARPGAPRRLPTTRLRGDAVVVSEHRSPLWRDGRDDEFILRAGKVHNLRIAAATLDGVEVPAGAIFSFWAQLGRPARGRGYVIGREIVAGCVVPTIAGGLCQLSNALATAAHSAGIDLVERHRHSARIEEAGPAGVIDATVAWNHVDLRLRARFAFRIEARLDAEQLTVRILRGDAIPAPAVGRVADTAATREAPVARGCFTCDERGCFRHRGETRPAAARTAVLVNEHGPEFAALLSADAVSADWFLPWLRAARRARSWSPPPTATVWTARAAGYLRTLRQQLRRGEGGARQAGRVVDAAALAGSYARRLHPEHTDLVISQDLLVPLYRAGALGGRRYTVWVGELPAGELQARLDAAARRATAAPSLTDFRVDPDWIADERAALAGAHRRVTAHADIARVLHAGGMTVERRPWRRATTTTPPTHSARPAGAAPTLVLAGSALPRKGSVEVAAVARRLAARVLILGSPPGDLAPWHGIDWQQVGYASDWLARADVVLLPAVIEHQPRALLAALDAGVPVVATAACGIDPEHGLILIEAGDVDALERAVRVALAAATP